jgi:DNA-directed RNA polymerase subunit M/transcription elongation factor TFIIS
MGKATGTKRKEQTKDPQETPHPKKQKRVYPSRPDIELRTRCRKNLRERLESTLSLERLERIEMAIYHLYFFSSSTSYKSYVRSLLANVPKNVGFFTDTDPEEIAALPVTEWVRGTSVEQQRKTVMAIKLQQNIIGQSIGQTVAIEGLRCKCGSHNLVRTASLQLRSADEPMTHFFECNDCGHKLKI